MHFYLYIAPMDRRNRLNYGCVLEQEGCVDLFYKFSHRGSGLGLLSRYMFLLMLTSCHPRCVGGACVSLNVPRAGHRVFFQKLLSLLGVDADAGGRGTGWLGKAEEGCSSGL